MSSAALIFILSALFLVPQIALADEFNDFENEPSRPAYIPETFNDKSVQPIIPGDFEEYWELWTGRQYFNGNETVSDLFLMKTRFKHRSYEGIKVGSISNYGANLRFIPLPDRDVILMTNGRELDVYTLWGKKSIETQPIRSYQYQFVFQNWLFINETMVIDLDYALRSDRPLNEKNLMWNYNVIPWETLEKTVSEYVAQNCFTLGYHCIIDQDDGRLLMSNTEVVSYRYGLKMSVLETSYTTENPKHHFYMMEDDITNLAFYVPHDLETFKRPVNFPYLKRYMLFPNPKSSDRFITTRRHQIFVRNNRNQFQFQRHLPAPESCKCEQESAQVYFEEPLSFSFQPASTIILVFLTLVIHLID